MATRVYKDIIGESVSATSLISTSGTADRIQKLNSDLKLVNSEIVETSTVIKVNRDIQFNKNAKVKAGSLQVGESITLKDSGSALVLEDNTGKRFSIAQRLLPKTTGPDPAFIPQLEPETTVVEQSNDTETQVISTVNWTEIQVDDFVSNEFIFRATTATTGLRLVIRENNASGRVIARTTEDDPWNAGDGFTLAASGDTTVVLDAAIQHFDGAIVHVTLEVATGTFGIKGDTIVFGGQPSAFVPYFGEKIQKFKLPLLADGGGFNSVLTGDVAITAGSAAVVGTGTLFTTELVTGQAVQIREENFTILTITDNLNLTLSANHVVGAGPGIGGGKNALVFAETDLLTVRTFNSTTRVTVDKLGRMGIGTTSPGSPLEVNGAIKSIGAISFGKDQVNTASYTAGLVRKQYDSTSSGAANKNAFITNLRNQTPDTFTISATITGSAGANKTQEFIGYVFADTQGEYEFDVNSDDAGQLEVDGEIVATHYGTHPADGTGVKFKKSLEIGYHRILARHDNGSGGDSIVVQWKKPGAGSFVTLPAGDLYHDTNDLFDSVGSGNNSQMFGNVGINEFAPTSKLHVKGDTTAPAVFINQTANGIGLDINTAATTAVALDIDGDAITTVGLATFTSNSADTGTRNLVDIVNSNTASTNATPLHIQQVADAPAMRIDQVGNDGGLLIFSNSINAPALDIVNDLTQTSSLIRVLSRSTDTSTRTLIDITNDDPLATATTVMTLKQDAPNTVLDINQDADGQCIRIFGPLNVSQTVLNVSGCNSLVFGRIAFFESNSSSVSTRSLVDIVNNHTSATGATPLRIQQDAAQRALFIDHNADGRSIDISSSATTSPVIRVGNPLNQSGSIISLIDNNALTTGNIIEVNSNSTSTSTRDLVLIENQNTASSGTTVLHIKQVGTQATTNPAAVFEGGRVGIGIAAPAGILHTQGAAGTDAIVIHDSSGASSGSFIQWRRNGSVVSNMGIAKAAANLSPITIGINDLVMSATAFGSNLIISADVSGKDILFGVNSGSGAAEIARFTSAGLLDLKPATGGVVQMGEIAAVPGGAPAATKGKYWVRNDTPNVPMFTDDDNIDHVLNGVTRFLYMRWSGNEVIGSTHNFILNTVVVAGNISQSAGVFTLIAGYTYILEAALNANYNGVNPQSTRYTWVNSTNNVPLVSGSDFVLNPVTHNGNAAPQFVAKVIFTATSTTTVRLRATSSAGGGIVQTGASYVYIHSL